MLQCTEPPSTAPCIQGSTILGIEDLNPIFISLTAIPSGIRSAGKMYNAGPLRVPHPHLRLDLRERLLQLLCQLPGGEVREVRHEHHHRHRAAVALPRSTIRGLSRFLGRVSGSMSTNHRICCCCPAMPGALKQRPRA